MSDEMKKPLGENLALCPPPRDDTRGLIQAVCHSSVVFHTFFFGNTSNGGMKCPFGLRQVTTVTRDPRSADLTEDI
jgi:hypothetical protein